MSVEYLEEQILDLHNKFKNARNQRDKDLQEADMQYIGAVFRMLEFSIDLSRELRQMRGNKTEVC